MYAGTSDFTISSTWEEASCAGTSKCTSASRTCRHVTLTHGLQRRSESGGRYLRNFHEPTAADKVDKQALPKVLRQAGGPAGGGGRGLLDVVALLGAYSKGVWRCTTGVRTHACKGV